MTKIIAHRWWLNWNKRFRGRWFIDNGFYGENSSRTALESMTKNPDIIEIDVNQCKSGEFVVFHDLILDNKTTWKWFVAHHTLTELKKLQTINGDQIETFDEFMAKMPQDESVEFLIEIKWFCNMDNFYAMIAKYENFLQRFYVQSFLLPNIVALRKRDKQMRIWYAVFLLTPASFVWAKQFNLYFINCWHVPIYYFPRFFGKLINQFRANWVKIALWTVDTKKKLSFFKSWNFRAVVSNVAHWFKKMV